MKQHISTFLIFFFCSINLNAQITDSLSKCERVPYFFIVNYSADNSNIINAKYSFEQGGSKYDYKKSGNATFNKRYSKLDLDNKLNFDNDILSFYKITFDDLTIYVDSDNLQSFTQEILTNNNAEYIVNHRLSLANFFNSEGYKKYIDDRKKNKPKYENGYCFNWLTFREISKIKTSKAIKNILVQIKNEGKIVKIDNNLVEVLAKDDADFTPDIDYYIIGKPLLRVRFKMNKGTTNFNGIVRNINDDKIEINENDIITNILN